MSQLELCLFWASAIIGYVSAGFSSFTAGSKQRARFPSAQRPNLERLDPEVLKPQDQAPTHLVSSKNPYKL